jgi:aryl-alcohol dehydrogenase-like predicted oxidoreductase
VIIRGGVARGEPGAGLGSESRWKAYEQAKLDELRETGETPTSFLLRYTLTHPHAHTIIVGTLKPEHLKENIRVIQKGPLPQNIYAEAKRRLDSIGVIPK